MMRYYLVRYLFLTLTIAGAYFGPASAKEASYKNPCIENNDLKFLIGDWMVYSAKTDALLGFLQVENSLQKCAITETLTVLSDSSRPLGMPVRVKGFGIYARQPSGVWHHFFVDNTGFTTYSEVALSTDKGIMLTSKPTTFGGDVYEVRIEYQLSNEGHIKNRGLIRTLPNGDWVPNWDLTYKPNR